MQEAPWKPAGLALDDRAWSFVVAADAELVCYGGLQESCTKNAAAWQAFLESDAPQDLALPPPYDASLSSFQRLLALKVFRPEKVVFGMSQFVGLEMGAFFKEAPPFDLKSTYDDSSPRTPIASPFWQQGTATSPRGCSR